MEEIFVKWLEKKNLSKEYLRDLIRSAYRLELACKCEPKCIRNRILQVRTKTEKRVIQNYIRFCELFGELDLSEAMRLRRLLNQLINDRGKKIGIEEVNISLDNIKVRESVRPYFVFQYFSGLRLTEVLLTKQILMEGKEPQIIGDENGYIPLNYVRGAKIATYAFAPLDVFEVLKEAKLLKYSYLKRFGLGLKLRENWYQKCIQILSYPELCKWIQGRVGDLGVSERHYLDLLNKAKQFYPVLSKALKGELSEEEVMRRLMLVHLRRLGFLL